MSSKERMGEEASPGTRISLKEKVGTMTRIANNAIGVLLFAGLLGLPAGAQNQAQTSSTQSASSGQSLGDYARQIRKSPETGAKAKVFDNDNLPKNDKLSIVGVPAQAETPKSEEEAKTEGAATGEEANAGEAKPGEAKAAPTTGNEESKKTGDEEANRLAAEKQWNDKLDTQKQQIDLLSRELDVLQREYQLRAAAMYADAGNRLRNQGDWDKQDAQYKQQIADKQKSLDDAKEKLSDIQEEARKAGMPESVQEQ